MLRENVWAIGSAMLLCPPQYHTSPYVTWLRLVWLPVVSSVATIVQSPPFAPGTAAFHVWLNTVALTVMLAQPAPLTVTVTDEDDVAP